MPEAPNFDGFLGVWFGSWRTWLHPEVLHDESPIQGEIRALLGGRGFVYSYAAGVAGAPVAGTALVGSRDDGGCTVAWVDSWHTGGSVMVSHGAWDNHGLEVATTYGVESELWVWTTGITLADNRLLIRHWNAGHEVDKYLAVEAILERG